LKNAVFWDVPLCSSCVNRRFGGTYRLNLQGIFSHRHENLKSYIIRFLVHYPCGTPGDLNYCAQKVREGFVTVSAHVGKR
jgi:hypothetical protein